MATQSTCPNCGTRLPDDAPRGLCPACLLGAGLTAETDATATVTGPPDAETRTRSDPNCGGSETVLEQSGRDAPDRAATTLDGARGAGMPPDAARAFGDYELLGEIA